MTATSKGDPCPYCATCHARMTCQRNGWRLDLGHYWAQYGDLYECPTCNARIVSGWGDAHEERPTHPSGATR